ncbi:hypothetical protein evm_007233 [Chilo suppressalis]|nr:hypothetical protein evm_007233 [Chilo suppressalis]
MKPFISIFSCTNWYLKYVGIPVTVGIAVYVLLNQICTKRRRAALQGKVVLITGASSGIGEALAHAFYDQGSKVVLAARRLNELERVKQDLQSKKLPIKTHEPVILVLDLADLDTIDNFVQKVYELCGNIDILINNGGVSHRGSILHSKMEVFKQIMFINYFGSVGLTKAVLPKMVERKSGHIVFVSSVQGLIAIPDRAAYAASKHAMQAFGDSLRAEMKQHQINVTVVSPGYIKTAVSLNALNESGGSHGVMDKSTASGFTAEYLAERMLNSIVNKENELIVSQFIPNLAIFLRHFTPYVYFWFMGKRAMNTKLQN